MKVRNILVTIVITLALAIGSTVNAFGVALTVGSAAADLRSDHTVSIDISVDNPSQITGAAFTLTYDTSALTLTSVQSDFFATFAEQFTNWAPQDSLTQLLQMLNESPYSQPLLMGPQGVSGARIAAARVKDGELSNTTIFTLTFDISNATTGNYIIGLSPTVISNTAAGYSAGGEVIPMLTGSAAPSLGQDLTNPATFPTISITAIQSGAVAVMNSTEVEITNKPSQVMTTVEAGDSSAEFRVAGGDDSLYTWTVKNDDNQLIDTRNGGTYTFTAPSTGAFAGSYTVTVADFQGFTDSFTINVPLVVSPETLSFTETKLNGTANPQTFTVTGAENDADFTWEILAAQGAADEVANPENYGVWEDASPVYSGNTNVLTPANVDVWTSFYLRVTVDNDLDLNQANGLYRKVAGPFTLVPVGAYNVYLNDSYGAINGTALAAGDITVHEVSTNQTKTTISAGGVVSFLLPDSGGTFHYEIKDNRIPSMYLNKSVTSAAKSVDITLEESNGLDSIDGLVEDVLNAPVAGAAIVAYQPANAAVRYTTTTNAEGAYSLNLPVGAAQSGWSVAVSHPDYITERRDDQTAGIVDFTGDYALYTETRITNVTSTRINSTVRIDITAKPAITNIAEVDVTETSGSGSLSAPVLSSNIDAGATATYFYNKATDFEAIITADTSEDYNPNTGYAASQSLTYVNDLTALTKVYLGSNGGNATMQANEQTASASVPPGGIDGDIYLTIEQYVSTGSDARKHPYVYDITAYDNLTDTVVSASAIHYLEVTLPIDLSMISPGDLENEKWVIHHAKDIIAMNAGDSRIESNSVIISTDYVGDGKYGSVTFLTSSLSAFGIALADGGSTIGSGSSSSGAGGGGCFIATSSNDSILDLYTRILSRLQNAFRHIAE
jgi:hypothetical protein